MTAKPALLPDWLDEFLACYRAFRGGKGRISSFLRASWACFF